MAKSLLIPANPKRKYAHGGSEIGSILTHAAHIEENGGVLWELVIPGGGSIEDAHMKHSEEIQTGYLYDVPSKKVTHKIDIEWIKNYEEISWQEIKKFTQKSRLKAAYPTREIFQEGYSAFFYILIRNIFLLKTPRQLHDFKKVSDGSPVSNLRNYAVVEDSAYAHFDRSITRADIMSEFIADLLVRSDAVKEKDVEDLFFLRLLKNQRFVERQGSYKKAGRLDLLFEDKKGNLQIYELKRDVASVDSIAQINRYTRAVSKKYKMPQKSIKRIIIARDAEPKLRSKAKSEGIELLRYSFHVKTQRIL